MKKNARFYSVKIILIVLLLLFLSTCRTNPSSSSTTSTEKNNFWTLLEEGLFKFRMDSRSSGVEYRYSKFSFSPFEDNEFSYNQASKTFEKGIENRDQYTLEGGAWILQTKDDVLIKGVDEIAHTVTYRDQKNTVELVLTLHSTMDISNSNVLFEDNDTSLLVPMGSGAKEYSVSYLLTVLGGGSRYELNEEAKDDDTGTTFSSLGDFITLHSNKPFNCTDQGTSGKKCVEFDGYVGVQTSGTISEWVFDDQYNLVSGPTNGGTWEIGTPQGMEILSVNLISPGYNNGDGWDEIWSIFEGNVWRGTYNTGVSQSDPSKAYNRAVINYIGDYLNSASDEVFIDPNQMSTEYIWLSDTDPQVGEIAGNLEIRKAFDETYVSEYNLYWGIDAVTKYSTTPLATYVKTGMDHNYVFSNNTLIPSGATHFIVTTTTTSGIILEGRSIPIPDMRDIRTTPQGVALITAGFVYIPGGFDVDDDGINEPGFWVSKYEAKNEATPVPNLSIVTPRQILQGGQLYNSYTTRFDARLCNTGNHSTATDSSGDCRGNIYLDNSLNLVGISYFEQVQFMASGSPVVNYSWIEARHALQSSTVAVSGTYLDLPTEVQWLQMAQLIVHHDQNWTGGSVGTGMLYQGHSDDLPAGIADASTDDNAGYFGTGGDTAPSPQRRTFYISNWRDLNVPPDYEVKIWDLAGNVDEYTRGIISARSETSVDGITAGGDRFAGAGGPMDWDFLESNYFVPLWWLPEVNNDMQQFMLTHVLHGAGSYHDGFLSSGALVGIFDIGYGNTIDEAGVSVITRGGRNDSSSNSGINNVTLEHGPGFGASLTGFRAVVVIPDSASF